MGLPPVEEAAVIMLLDMGCGNRTKVPFAILCSLAD